MTIKETNKIPVIGVVDRSSNSISLYQFALQTLDVDFIGFSSFAKALPYLQENQPNLLFSDSLSLLKNLRTLPLHTNTAMIMVASKDSFQERQSTEQLGALDFLIKPLHLKEIHNIVCRYVEVKSK